MTKNNKITVYLDLLKEKKRVAKAISNIEKSILYDVNEKLEMQLKDKDYNCGTATVEYEGYNVKFTVSKNIKYNQEKLDLLADKISGSGDDLNLYMKKEYKVSENAFKSWSKPIQNAFMDARTVKPNKAKIEVKENDE